MNNQKTYALVTGASQGLGKEIAIELAKQNHNLILVSLEKEGLTVLAEMLE